MLSSSSSSRSSSTTPTPASSSFGTPPAAQAGSSSSAASLFGSASSTCSSNSSDSQAGPSRKPWDRQPPLSSTDEEVYDDDDARSTLTLTNSVRQSLFKVVAGCVSSFASRTFQNLNDAYTYPLDSEAVEYERLSEFATRLRHNGHGFKDLDGDVAARLTAAGEDARILDLGCGVKAVWCCRMAELWPSAEVIGADLIPVDLDFAPPNFNPEIYDVLDGLPYPSEFFDVIHQRNLSKWVPDLGALFREVHRCLKPGGIFLVMEPTRGIFTRTPWTAPHRLAMQRDNHYQQAAETTGIRFERSLAIPQLMGQMSHLWSKAVIIDVDMDIGATATDPMELQALGLAMRELNLLTWALIDSARGETAEAQAEARLVDQQLLPAEAGGLYCKALTVLAIKGH